MNLKKLIVVTITLVTLLTIDYVCCILDPLPDEQISRESLVQCIIKACKMHVESGEIIKLSLALTEVDNIYPSATVMDRLLLKALFDSDMWQVVIKKYNDTLDGSYLKTIQNYIIQIRHKEELEDHLRSLKMSSDWNPHAKFLVISARPLLTMTSEVDNRSVIFDDMIRDFTNLLWSYKITNGLIYLPKEKDLKKFDVYSYYPFKDYHCGDPGKTTQVINTCSFGKYKFNGDLFKDKIPKNLHGCKVRVKAVVFPPYVIKPKPKRNRNKMLLFENGLEIEMLNFIANISNITLSYSTVVNKSDWGSIYENGTATGSLLSLKNEDIDLVLGAFSVTLERLKYFDVLTYDFLEDITMCVPHALDKSQWEKLIDVMNFEAWCVVLVGFLLVCLFLTIVAKKTEEERANFKKFQHTIQHAISVLVNIPITQPKTLKVRLILFVWVLFCLHATVAYQTSLISFLTKPKYKNQISTIEDVGKKNYTVLLLSNTVRYFDERNDVNSMIISRNMKICTDVPKCLHDVAYERKWAMGSPRLYMKYALSNYKTRYGEPLLYCFKDSLVTYSLGMLMWKGFPLKPLFSKLLSSITSSGLIMKWEKEIFAAKLKNDTDEEVIFGHNARNHKLSLIDLEAVFILWIVGISMGFIVFLLELHHHKYTRKILG